MNEERNYSVTDGLLLITITHFWLGHIFIINTPTARKQLLGMQTFVVAYESLWPSASSVWHLVYWTSVLDQPDKPLKLSPHEYLQEVILADINN